MEKPKIDLESLALELQELVQCPVCLGSLDDSVTQCCNGHGVCGGCKGQLSRCPSCNGGFVVQKSTLLCKLLGTIPLPCPFTDKGCTETVMTKDHKSFCNFRPVDCKIGDCTWKGCLRDLSHHVTANHKNYCFPCEGLGIKYNLLCACNESSYESGFYPFILNTHFFWVWEHIDRKSKRHIYRFYYLPNSKTTEDYYLVVAFKKDNLQFTSVSKASVNMDNADRAVDANDSGLLIPDDIFDLFLKENETDKYVYSWEITK